MKLYQADMHIHICLSPCGDRALTMQAFVYDHLPGQNSPDVWGDQVVVDENDDVISENIHLLIGATTLSIYELVSKVNDLDGLCIASHIDRPAFGIVSNLGFIPEDLRFTALEVSWRMPLNKAAVAIPGISHFPCITSSDAHYIDDIGKVWTGLMMKAPLFDEIRMAFAGRSGRRIVQKETIEKEAR